MRVTSTLVVFLFLGGAITLAAGAFVTGPLHWLAWLPWVILAVLAVQEHKTRRNGS